MGLAGWLCAETGAELWTSRTEWLNARLLAQDTSEEWVAAGRRFDNRAGLDEALIEERAARGNLYRRRVASPPASFRRVKKATGCDLPTRSGGCSSDAATRRRCSACSARSTTC